MEKIKLSEKENQDIIASWYEESKKQNQHSLPAFIDKLINSYQHDYGTICHAVAAAGIAGMYAIQNSPTGGITGFQAGCIMWEVIRNWETQYKNVPLRLLNYENLLYPQYACKFNSISKETWKWVQDKAKESLESKGKDYVHVNVYNHWKSIVNGEVPFGLEVKD